MASDAGISNAAPSAANARPATNTAAVGAAAHSSDASVNTAVPNMKMRRLSTPLEKCFDVYRSMMRSEPFSIAHQEATMTSFLSISSTAFLIADTTRTAMLTVLMDGRAYPAGELARAAGVTAQTASFHLGKLLEGGLIVVETQGQHRYHRIAGSHVAQTLESLAAIQPESTRRPKTPAPRDRPLRHCRRCYDHMAGQVGVAITRALQDRGYIRASTDQQFTVTAAGAKWFASVGVDVAAIKPTRRGLARQCLDWTERVPHLGGPLGVHLLAALCAKDWLRVSKSSRVVMVTPKGWVELERSLGVTERMVNPGD